MKKKLVTLFAFITTALVLVACGGSVGTPPPPPIEATAVETIDPSDPTAEFYGNRGVIVTVPSSLTGDLVVFEATGNRVNKVVVRDSNQHVIAASVSPDYFVPASAAGTLEAQETEIQTAAVPGALCFGPCVVLEHPGGTQKFYVEVHTTGATEFFAYSSDYGDAGEPGNDNALESVDLHPNTITIGAFETLYDEDIYAVYQQSFVTIDTSIGTGWNAGLLMIVEVNDPSNSQDWVELSNPADWVNQEWFSGTLFRVSTAGGYGGSFEASKYRIIVN